MYVCVCACLQQTLLLVKGILFLGIDSVSQMHLIYFQEFDYRSIRVNTPIVLVVNGRKLGREKQAATILSVSALSD